MNAAYSIDPQELRLRIAGQSDQTIYEVIKNFKQYDHVLQEMYLQEWCRRMKD